LIHSKIIQIVATSCQILRLKCTKFDFGWGDPAGGAYSVPPDLLAGIKGAFSKCGPHDFDPPPSQKNSFHALVPLICCPEAPTSADSWASLFVLRKDCGLNCSGRNTRSLWHHHWWMLIACQSTVVGVRTFCVQQPTCESGAAITSALTRRTSWGGLKWRRFLHV